MYVKFLSSDNSRSHKNTVSMDYNTVLGALIKHTFTSKVEGKWY
jgi:hypothetical protein